MKRASQKETIFYILYKRFKAKDHEYLPVFGLMGETFIKEIGDGGKWGYVSYECSARASEMMKENPGLLQRQWITGRSGARYYGYRINPQPKVEMIKDPKLINLHRRLMGKRPLTKADHEREVDRIFNEL